MENQILERATWILAETEVHGVLDNAMDQLIQLSGAERGIPWRPIIDSIYDDVRSDVRFKTLLGKVDLEQ
jgi:hypothetical protein